VVCIMLVVGHLSSLKKHTWHQPRVLVKYSRRIDVQDVLWGIQNGAVSR